MVKKIYVGNLDFKTKDSDLKDMFSEFGEIEDCFILTDKEAKRSKGFGFVTFVNEADADAAVKEMNEKEVDGRKLKVNEAQQREEKPLRKFDSHKRYDDDDEYSKYFSTKIL